MTIDEEHALMRAPSVAVHTRGRRTGHPHRVVVWFVYRNGSAFFLAHAGSHGRGTDWYRNLIAAGEADIEAGGTRFRGRPVTFPAPERAVANVVEMFENKYGCGAIESWYQPGARIAVCIRLADLEPEGQSASAN
jgi:deazaflavin-dependent oxidoreductase (nitroreductase family)